MIDIKSCKIAIVVSLFNREITQELQNGAMQQLLESGILPINILVIEVPGAIEIPMVIQRIAQNKEIDVVIALGAIIRGETSHYDYVCQQVSYGCQRVALDYTLPVIFGILTTENLIQAFDRIGGKHGHKGIDAAECAITMYNILQKGCKL